MVKYLIVFDIDGTLINHEFAVKKALGSIHNKIAENISLETFTNIWNKKQQEYVNLYLENKLTWEGQRLLRVKESFKEGNIKLNDKEAKEIFLLYLKQYENNWKLYEDVLPALESIKHNILCIVSNGNSTQQRYKIKKTKINKYFDRIIISGDINISKPDNRIFEECIKNYKLDRNLIYHVGNSYETDVIGALNANIVPILINRSGKSNNNNNKNEFLEINSLLEIADIIR